MMLDDLLLILSSEYFSSLNKAFFAFFSNNGFNRLDITGLSFLGRQCYSTSFGLPYLGRIWLGFRDVTLHPPLPPSFSGVA